MSGRRRCRFQPGREFPGGGSQGGTPCITAVQASCSSILSSIGPTGEQRYLDTAISGGNEILASRDDGGASVGDLQRSCLATCSSLNELAKASAQGKFRDAAAGLVRKMADQSQPLGSGIGWIEPIPFSDITGITGERESTRPQYRRSRCRHRVFSTPHRNALDPQALEWAIKTADRLIEMSVDGEGGPELADDGRHALPVRRAELRARCCWRSPTSSPICTVRQASSAISTWRSLQLGTSRRTRLDNAGGHLVCHTDQNPGLYYLGVCHGPPGTGRLMYLLHEITGDDHWLEWLHTNMRGPACKPAHPSRAARGCGTTSGSAAVMRASVITHCGCTGPPAILRTLDVAQRVAAVIIERSHRRWQEALVGAGRASQPPRLRRVADRLHAGRCRDRQLPAAPCHQRRGRRPRKIPLP